MNYSVSKTLLSFTKFVNPKIEPHIQSSWVKKINHNGGEDNRFLVATKSNLFMCANRSFTHSLKILHVYPYVTFKGFNMITWNCFQIIFLNATLKLYCDQPSELMSPILSVILSILPNMENIKTQIPTNFNIVENINPSKQFIYLFLSYCRYLELDVNEALYSNIKKMVLKKNLKIVHDYYNDKLVQALCLSAQLTSEPNSIQLGGKNFPKLFLELKKIIDKNDKMIKITIKNYQNCEYFESFLESLQKSKVISLTFKHIPISQQMLKLLSSKLPDTLTSLSFINCNCNSFHLNVLFDNPEAFKHLNFFDISQNEIQLPPATIPKLITFISSSKITSMNFRNMGIDIAIVFKELMSDFQIMSLNLSENYCSTNLKDNYQFSTTLSKLNLSKVKWEGNTLIKFLTNQVFTSAMDLNLSYFILTNNSYLDAIKKLVNIPPSPMISKLKWNGNILTPNFFDFISKYSFLEKVSFNYCSIPNHYNKNILESMKTFLQFSNITSLSIVETFKNYQSYVLEALSERLIQQKTLIKLNVSKNNIGEEGLSILENIILNNSSLLYVYFDNNNIRDYNALVQFFNHLQKSSHLIYLSKPKFDIDQMTNNSPKSIEKQINEAWSSIVMKMKKNSEDLELTQDIALNSALQSSFRENRIFQFTDVQTPNISWDLDIKINYDKKDVKWNELKKEFSISSLTGVPSVCEPTSDLIIF